MKTLFYELDVWKVFSNTSWSVFAYMWESLHSTGPDILTLPNGVDVLIIFSYNKSSKLND